jgi:outer membrane protein OmpA-like peptidoglycan-associated protein
MAVALCQVAGAQQAAAPKAEGDELPDKVELSGFGGASFFQQVDKGLGTKLVNGGAFGFRATENFWRYVGLEQAFTYSANNVRFLSPVKPGGPNYDFGQRIYQYSLNPVFYFTERGSKIRPFLTVGASALNFTPTDSAKGWARSPLNVPLGASGLDSNLKVGMNYGGGIKMHLSDHVGLRFDVRGIMSPNPTFRLPDYATGGLYIPRKEMLHGVQTTVGLTYYIGEKYVPPPPAPPPPPSALAALSGGSLSAGAGTLCQGRAITVRSMGVSDPAGRNITYKWKVNGQPMGGSTPELTFTPDRAGNYMIELETEAPNAGSNPVRTAKASTLSLNVQAYNAPTVTACNANPAALQYGQTSALSARGAGSACSTINFLWTASEGTITNGTSATATFDSKSVRFEQGGKIQSKTVTATAKVADDRGAVASCNTTIKVDYNPTAVRFSDIIFGKNSARVNNCGKRVLLEEVGPKAADPDYEIVLVGHIDQDEVSKTKKPSTLDMQRVANAYAVLTGGTGTCANVDKSRVKVDWVGTEQTSDMQPGLCGTSARATTKERSGSMVSTADQNRRVEVWLVPKGTKMPAAFKGAKDIDAKLLKKLACPK